jgi:hypothetical protein
VIHLWVLRMLSPAHVDCALSRHYGSFVVGSPAGTENNYRMEAPKLGENPPLGRTRHRLAVDYWVKV